MKVVARKHSLWCPSLFLEIRTLCCGFWVTSAVLPVPLQQSSFLLPLILPFLSISPILLFLLQQTKSNALLLSLFAPQGDEKSLAVALCWPVLLAQSRTTFNVDWPFLCVFVCVCVSVCVPISVCFTSHCFVKWFVLTAFPRPAAMVTLISRTHTHMHTHTRWIIFTKDSAIGRQRGYGIQKGIIRELASSRPLLMTSSSSFQALRLLLMS